MTISDHSRHLLHQRLEAVLGREDAATLMAHLPPVGWADVATRRDLDHFAAVLRAEMAAGDAAIRSDLKDEMMRLHAEVLKEIGGLRGDMARQMPTLFLGLVGLQISAAGIAIAVSHVV